MATIYTLRKIKDDLRILRQLVAEINLYVSDEQLIDAYAAAEKAQHQAFDIKHSIESRINERHR
jgi:hypothetical protein